MKGMILAAGLGTRLQPLTFETPKPMAPLCNRPLLDWAVESYLEAGVSEIVVNLHYLPEPIERHLAERFGSRARLHFSFEPEILGTGGGVRRVRSILERDEEFFLVNGDTLQFPRYDALRRARSSGDALAALTLRHPPTGDRFTAVWLDDGRITGFGEGHGEPLMFSGSHAISSRYFPLCPDREVFGIVDAVYQPVLAAGSEAIAGVVDDGLWFDVGTPRRYLDATAALLRAMTAGEVAVPQGSSLRAGSLADGEAVVHGPLAASVVGARSRVDGSLSESVVWEDCAIGRGVRLERCIVGSGVELADECAFAGSVICRDAPEIPADVPRRGGLVIVPVS